MLHQLSYIPTPVYFTVYVVLILSSKQWKHEAEWIEKGKIIKGKIPGSMRSTQSQITTHTRLKREKYLRQLKDLSRKGRNFCARGTPPWGLTEGKNRGLDQVIWDILPIFNWGRTDRVWSKAPGNETREHKFDLQNEGAVNSKGLIPKRDSTYKIQEIPQCF